MSAARLSKGMAAICTIAFLLAASPAYSQEAPATRLPTIADCPPGYTLGVQDTAEPQPVTTTPATGYENVNETAAPGIDVSAAPRRFITGCIPPQQEQQ
jgi:hypothetical protein